MLFLHRQPHQAPHLTHPKPILHKHHLRINLIPAPKLLLNRPVRHEPVPLQQHLHLQGVPAAGDAPDPRAGVLEGRCECVCEERREDEALCAEYLCEVAGRGGEEGV